MVQSCAVAVCKNQRGRNSCKNSSSNVVYHCFPKDSSIRSIWIKRCNRTEEFKYRNASICSIHFRPEDYTRDLKSELLNLPTRKKLMPRAVPSLYLTPADIVSKTLERGSKVENQFTGCAILRCKNGAIGCIMPGIKLFRFPGDRSVRSQWVNACKRKQFKVDEAFICSNHFKKEDFAASKLLSKKLKPDAIPTLKLPVGKSTVQEKKGNVSENESSLTPEENKHVVEITIESPTKKNEANFNIKRPLSSQEESAAKRANTKFVEEILREYDKKLELEQENSLISTSQNIKPSKQKTIKNLKPTTTINLKQNTTNNNSKEKNGRNVKQMIQNKKINLEQKDQINIEQNLSNKVDNSPDSDLSWKQQFENAQQEIEMLKKDNLALVHNDTLYWQNQIRCLKDENTFLKKDLSNKINKERQNCEAIWKFRFEKVRKSETLLKRQVIALKKTNRNLKNDSDNLYFTKDENEPDKSFTEVEFNTRDSKSSKFVYWSVNDVPTAISTLIEIEKTLYLDNL